MSAYAILPSELGVGWEKRRALVDEAELADASEDRLMTEELLRGVPGKEGGAQSWDDARDDNWDDDDLSLSLLLRGGCKYYILRNLFLTKIIIKHNKIMF